ncbi:MAG: bifunctional (p)ppGpp synthetase/guanosine-3',5'-bis(diphosphate) 3'-pyrophosphohydrolase [Actinomycetota bacterium]|nr:bifunctional (p)ppGpp synthetase/guanosine-3',5'-bis(diphosphate) 3'-pyrophosphohydrolase [Actinomycetota bacterium]
MGMAVRGIEDLLNKVRAYNPGADMEFIKRAYFFSSEAHGEQKRKEGSPYIEHPLAVASVLADMKMDTVSIAAGLLHDTIEDTPTIKEDIQKRFGYELAFLVDSVTKLGKIQFQSSEEAQAENFRRMLLSMAEDIRVVMVKFADRLHNMRTLQYLPEEKRKRIAQETLEIYAPLANRLGIGWLRIELENLSFKHLMPEVYEDLVRKVATRREEQEGYVNVLIGIVKNKLANEGIKAQVKGRIKHYYGIWQKMQRQEIPFDQIYDVLGIRIITDTKASCYAVLGLIHSLWKPIPGKFKDYIGVPKSNMYQSLHTTVVGPEGRRVEFQIRTEDMDKLAEEGIAAHWKYKERGHINPKDDRYIAWLRNFIQEIQDVRQTPQEFLDAVKSEVVPDTIYIFTPRGEIKELPLGATPVDFAYSIHTQVGHKCVGAKVNGRMVPLKYTLNNGDTVEILTSQNHTPSRDWLSFVTTSRARTRIRQWIKTEERKECIELGVKLLETEIRRRGLPVSLLKGPEAASAASGLSFEDPEDMLVAVGYGKISPQQVVNRIAPSSIQEAEAPTVKPTKQAEEEKGITITGMTDILYHLAKCCYPVPGDNLVGFITRGKGVSVHRKSCPNLPRLVADEERLISVQWKASDGAPHLAKVAVDTLDRPGIVANLSAAISSLNINIHHMEAITNQLENAHISFILEVKDRGQLNAIMQKLAQLDGVIGVRR